ncbi:class I SAM-dependent methyltransferase [Pseudomonas aeruginosa]|uniref:class I SAM-dependent methyltransferase n=1 Tax=Pseudomonas aeruginosa TaxID=287 RepID=UPI0018DFB85D|nr:methyltransferase domain-containing protein [Pseudomonas aeruginosa]
MNDLYKMFVLPEGPLGEQGGDLMARTGRAMAQVAVSFLTVDSTDRVLEIGFGPGVGLELLSALVSEGQVVGVDPSETMHQMALARNAGAIRLGRLSLVKGSVGALPFSDGSFNAALAIDNMHFWTDPLAGLKELWRVLRVDGRLVCESPRVSWRPQLLRR